MMMESILSTGSFIYVFNKIRPAEIVDKIIKLSVDILTPGGGVGESTWWMRGLRSAQRGSQRIEKEMEIRSNLAQWDEEFPFMHHELIVRYAAGFLASTLALTVYEILRGNKKGRR